MPEPLSALSLTGEGARHTGVALLTPDTVRCSERGSPPPPQVGTRSTLVEHYAWIADVPAKS